MDVTTRRWRSAAFAALIMVCGLFVATPQPAGAAAKGTYHRTFGYPDGQQGLTVEHYLCGASNRAAPKEQAAPSPWPFRIAGGSPDPYGPHGIGWTPPLSGEALGVETYFPFPTDVDIFRILLDAPAGNTAGFAQVWYYPPGSDVAWQGIARFAFTQDDWRWTTAAAAAFDWFRYSNGAYDGTQVLDQTVAGFTQSQGGDGEGAYFSFLAGCDGNPFSVDGFEVGSSVSGWDEFDLDGYQSRISLRETRSISTCQTSPARWPNKMSFRGSLAPAGRWLGWQYAGPPKKGKWRVVARGTTQRRFGYTARVTENSFFDADYPPTSTHEYRDTDDIYVPAFPSITLRASDRAVRKGQKIVFTGSIKPARKLTYTPLRAVAGKRGWTRFQSLGTRKTDNRGRFRFVVRTPDIGWARINIITQTEHDLTSTINPRAVLYEVLKPKKQPSPPPPNPVQDNYNPDPVQPEPDPLIPHGRRPRGYGQCGWYPTGQPPSRPIVGRGIPSDDGLGAITPTAPGAPLPQAPGARPDKP
jgi:hypothetical protein